jgi:hypothetical protein
MADLLTGGTRPTRHVPNLKPYFFNRPLDRSIMAERA